MVSMGILLIVVLLVIVIFYMRANRLLSDRLLETQQVSLKTSKVHEALWRNIHAYILLITDDFIVRRTNFYALSDQPEPQNLNKRVGELFSCKNALDAAGCGTHELCAECPVRNAITKAFKGKKSFSGVEASLTFYTSENKDTSVDCEVQVAGAYLDIDGKGEILLTVYDITKQKEIQKELERAKKDAEESNRLKSAFLANMSHEIRTPLSAIMGFSPLLATASTQEEKDSFVNIIRKNGELLLQLINDILDLSKIEAGTLEFIYSDVDLNAVMTELEGVFRMRLSDLGSPVQVKAVCDLPICFIRTERNRLSQVISNFLSNAVKFTTEGTITLGYEVREADIYFYVSDTGTGIAREALPKVFERFTKLDSKKQGTGLGLSISRMIIQKMGGQIGVKSEIGKGSEFWFVLPVKPLKSSEIHSDGGESLVFLEQEDEDKEENGKVKTILIAEDMEDNFLLCEALLGKRYKLLHAWNGEEAISLFLQNSPDVVLMDLRMPVVDGYQATEAIRQMSATVPIIAVTAFAFAEDKRKVLRSGFTDYLSKPIEAHSLFAKLKAVGL